MPLHWRTPNCLSGPVLRESPRDYLSDTPPYSEDAVGGGVEKIRGEENLTNDSPPKNGFCLRCRCSVFPVQNSTIEQTRSSVVEGSKHFREGTFSGTFSSPPYVLRFAPPHITAQPIARYGVFGVSTWPIGCDTPSPFSGRFPLGEHLRSGGAIPPPPLKRGISAILARYPMKTRQKRAIPPSAMLSRKGIVRYGGVSRTGPLSPMHTPNHSRLVDSITSL